MLSEIIKKQIEDQTAHTVANNAFFTAADRGELTVVEVKEYLYNIFYLFKQTTICLAFAEKKSQQMEMNALAKFFAHKITEEVGHDLWAQQDLESLGTKCAEVDLQRLNPTLRNLVFYIREIIDEDPRLYLFYMVFAEYFTVLAAPQFLENIEKKCGISREHMTALVNHGELDKEHAIEDFSIIDQFGNPNDLSAYSRVIATSRAFIEKFLTEILISPPMESRVSL